MLNFSRLKDIREDNDMTQSSIAEILSVKRSTYSLWELSINIIPLPKLCAFAEYFGVSVDYVLGLTNNRRSKRGKGKFTVQKLGLNMKRARRERGYSQEDVAKLLGFTQAYISKCEKGISCISILNLYLFSREFHVSLDSLCYDEVKEMVSSL